LSYYRDIFYIFVIISILDQAKGALRDLKIFSLTKNLRLIKQVAAPATYHLV